jgi:hypothetical protein
MMSDLILIFFTKGAWRIWVSLILLDLLITAFLMG